MPYADFNAVKCRRGDATVRHASSVRVGSALLVVIILLGLGIVTSQPVVRGQAVDTIGPTVDNSVTPGPPSQLFLTVSDAGSGLASIVIIQSENADTVVPPFTVGTNDPIVVVSTRIDQTLVSRVAITVTDDNGNVTSVTFEFTDVLVGDVNEPFVSASVAAGPPSQLSLTISDTESGLASILVTRSENADTVVPPFTVGTTDPVVVVSTRINQSQFARVTLTVTDVAGNEGSVDLLFSDTLYGDTTAPAAVASATPGPPARVTLTITDSGSGLSSIVVTRSENADTIVPPFTVGTNTAVVATSILIDQTQPARVTLIATDVDGNPATVDLRFDSTSASTITGGSFTVVAASGQGGVAYNFPTPTISGDPGTVTCSPESGSFFPIGVNIVTCMTTTGLEATILITVLDIEGPTIATRPDVTVNATSPAGAVVSYAPPAASDNAPGVTVACAPPPGSTFPVGSTTVTCTATDASGNTASSTFNVTVIGGDDLLGQLRFSTIAYVTNPATERAMLATLDRVRAAAEAGNTWGAYIGMITYVIQLDRAVTTRAVSPADARELALLARQALDAIR
jgi:hypothetical protein